MEMHVLSFFAMGWIPLREGRHSFIASPNGIVSPSYVTSWFQSSRSVVWISGILTT